MDHKVVRNIVAKLFSQDRELRLETLKEISIADVPAFDKALVYFYRSDPSIEEKIICIRSFHNLDRKGVLACIEDASNDEYFEIRLSAYKRISKLERDEDLIKYSYIILRGLLDSHPYNLTFCLDVFQGPKLKDKLGQVIAIHYDQKTSSSCLAVLFLIYELELSDQLFVLESSLNHKEDSVRSYATKLLPSYIKKFPHLKDLAVRTRESDTQQININQLSEVLVNKDVAVVVDYLIKMRKLPQSTLNETVLNCLLTHLHNQKNPFIIATIIKTLPCFKNFKAYDEISKFLLHEDQRVVANSVECLSEQDDKRVLEFISLKIAHLDYSCKEDLRIISGAMKILRKYEPQLALQYMRGLTVANDHAVYTYLHHVRSWDNNQLLDSMFLLLNRENRVRIVSSLCEYFKKYSDLSSFRKFIDLINRTTDIQKRKVLMACYDELLNQYRDQDIPILLDKNDLTYKDLLQADEFKTTKNMIVIGVISFLIIVIFITLLTPATSQVAPIKNESMIFSNFGDQSKLTAKIVNQDNHFIYIESSDKSFQLIKDKYDDYFVGDIIDLEVEYVKNTKFSEVKILKILSIKITDQKHLDSL